MAGSTGEAPGGILGDRLKASLAKASASLARRRFPLALASAAALWGFSLPPGGIGILGAAALALPIAALPGIRPAKALAWGWLGGFVWEWVTLWWLAPTITRYGGLSWGTAFALVAGVAAVLGLYMGGFFWSLSLAIERRGMGGLLAAPLLWVLWEWVKGHLFTGMPWWSPGYALTLYPSFLQATRFAGVLGLSFLAILACTALALGILDRGGRPALAAAMGALLLLAGTYYEGAVRLNKREATAGLMPVGYLQPGIPQDIKWDVRRAREIEERLLALSGAFRGWGLSLLVWPESCTPHHWDGDPAFRERVGAIAAEIGAPVLLGSVLTFDAGEEEFQNGAVLVLPGGGEGGRYAKAHLVPFGEYVPLRRFLSFAGPIVETVGDFRAGESLKPVSSPAGKLGISICFEGIFPSLIRRQVREGAEVLVNLTNDAWYEGTPGLVQHYFIQRVRAVEMGRYLVRSSNGGYSGIVDPMGRMTAGLAPEAQASFWGNVRPERALTPYARAGDAWLWLALGAVLLALAWPTQQERRV